MRSEPGKGKPVRLFTAQAMYVDDPVTWWGGELQEDYAASSCGCMWVKIDPTLPAHVAATLLRSLANGMDAEHQKAVREEIDNLADHACPQCGDESQVSFLNVHRQHYCICERCRIRWWYGDNLFSSWKEQTEEDWQANKQTLSAYRPYKWPANKPSPQCEEIPF